MSKSQFISKLFLLMWRYLLLIGAVAGILFYLIGRGESMDNNVSRVDSMFAKSRLACFGRFVISVPSSAKIVYGGVELDGALDVHIGQAKNMENLLALSMAIVEEEKSNIPQYEIDDFPMVGRFVDGIIPGQKILFGAKDSSGYTVRSLMPVGDNLYVLEKNSSPVSGDIVEELNDFARKIRPRRDDEVPSEKGVCVDGGFINIDAKHENFSIGLIMEDFPDVRFSIRTQKNQEHLRIGSSPRRLKEQAKERASESEIHSFFSRINILRDGSRQLSGWSGDEILTRRPAYKDDTESHEFRFFSLGAQNDSLKPMLDIRLDSGVSGDKKAKLEPGLSDEEALALWDRIVSSIRVREPSDGGEMTPHSVIALGIMAKTGDQCPQGGWWEYMGKESIEGNRRRLLATGAKMPPVIINRAKNIWRFMIGDVHRIEAASWRLVAYEEL